MRTSYLFVSLLSAVSGVACDRGHEPLTPAVETAQPEAVRPDDGGNHGVVKGNAPNSDPATDQSILARTSGSTGGAPGFDATKAPGSGGWAGFGMGGLAGASPVSRH